MSFFNVHSMDDHNNSGQPKKYFDNIKFKRTCRDNMKRYIEFLYYHHRYSVEKLEKYFSEYFDVV